MQQQQNYSHKTRSLHIEMIFNGSSKKELFCMPRKKKTFCYRDCLASWEILDCEDEKCVIFPESQYVNSNPVAS